MTTPIVVLNMIVRNAADTITETLDSLKPCVDFYVIGFAGASDDDTEAITTAWLEANAKDYLTERFDFVDFSDARNRVLALTPDELKNDPNAWLMWADADDIVMGTDELKGVLERIRPDIGVIRFPYIYQTDEHGNAQVIHDRERLLRFNLGWRWERPVHETLHTNIIHEVARLDTLTWVHNWKKGKENRSQRNLELLLKFQDEHPEVRRTQLEIAHVYYSEEQWAEALEAFTLYANKPENVFEKWQAAVFAGDCAMQLEDYDFAIVWYMQAVEDLPQLMDPYLGIAACYVRKEEYEKARTWYDLAEGKGLPPSGLFILPGRYTFNRWCYEHYVLAHEKRYAEAVEMCQKALEYSPDHAGFLYYFYGYREALDQALSMRALRQLVMHLQNRGDALAAHRLLLYTPKSLLDTPEYKQLSTYAYEKVKHLFEPEAQAAVYVDTDVDKTNMKWEKLLEYSPLQESRFEAIANRLAELAEQKRAEGKKLTIVDLGCGDAVFSVWLAQQGYLVTAVDSAHGNIERGKKLAELRGCTKNIRFIQGDVRSLDLNEIGSHDVALVLEVIEHVLEPALIAGNGLDLAPTLIMSTPRVVVGAELNNISEHGHLHHVREFDFNDLVKLSGALGANIKTIKGVYAHMGYVPLPGYGQWIVELTREGHPTQPPVVFYLGPGLEKWTPDQINEKGIGGSETAAVQLAKKFRDAGHPVFVYGPVDGVYDGVFYCDYKKFNHQGPAAGQPALLFVSSRIPEMFDYDVNAAVKWLWCHDADYGDRINPERQARLDAVLVLSEWQKQHFIDTHGVAEDKILVTGNGIDPERFTNLDVSERVKHRFIWSSSLDRGLDKVLDMWPAIREKLPDAELHIYYGLELADQMYGNPDSPYYVWYSEFKQRLNEGMQQEGVVYHGRVPQNELPKEFAKAGYWLYPTDFTETYCITALEAQAAGVIPVTSDVAALKERIAAGVPMISNGDAGAYLDQIMAWEENEDDAIRTKLRAHALKFTWQRTFDQWKRELDDTFNKKVAEAKARQDANDGNEDVHPTADTVGADGGGRG